MKRKIQHDAVNKQEDEDSCTYPAMISQGHDYRRGDPTKPEEKISVSLKTQRASPWGERNFEQTRQDAPYGQDAQ